MAVEPKGSKGVGRRAVVDIDAAIPIDVAANLLSVSAQWIRDLAKQGYLIGLVRGRVPLSAAVQGYIRFLKDESRRASKTAAQSEVQRERAKEIALRNARAAGELIQIDVVDTVFADVLGTYRAELAGLPAEFTRDLTERDRLDALLNDKIARAKAVFERRRDALRSGRADGLDGEETDA